MNLEDMTCHQRENNITTNLQLYKLFVSIQVAENHK